MKKQIFVYDKDMCFNYLLKKSYSDHFEIESYTTRKKIIPDSNNNYAAAFFTINTLEDFHFFLNSSELFKNLYVITSVRLFEFQISSMMSNNIVIFDFNDDVKKNIIRELDFQLKLKKLL
ncbi:hypothetical protein [Flavobacterium myungsuense]|uniref:IPExxxVDY family protein n=1 Tax=Flavobacterium myungsuense TaxID=651823 RepID=A0ABW3IZR3_9FLAO